METRNYYRGVVLFEKVRSQRQMEFANCSTINFINMVLIYLIENKLAMQQMCKNIIFFFILSALVTTTNVYKQP